MEVGLGPGHIVLDGGTAAPTERAQQPPLFGPCLLWSNDGPSQQLPSSCLCVYESVCRSLRQRNRRTLGLTPLVRLVVDLLHSKLYTTKSTTNLQLIESVQQVRNIS